MNFLPLIIVGVWVLLDQALKAWVAAHIPCCAQFSSAVTLIPGVLSLLHDVNKGAAWSLFSSATPLLIALRVLVGAGILVWVLRTPRLPRVQMLAYSLIAAGAFGNAIDGLWRGQVVDMLWSHWLSAVYSPFFHTEFPTFNLADTGVVVGVMVLLISSLFAPPKPKPVSA